MEITTWHEKGTVPVTVLQLRGDLNSTDPLEGRSQELFDEGTRNLILDLTEVNYISSAGLRAIHAIYMMLRSVDPEDEASAVRGITRGSYKSPHLKLVNPSKNGMKALATAGYDIFLDIFHNVPDAVDAFQ